MSTLIVFSKSAVDRFRDRRARRAAILAACWLAIILTGLAAVARYESRPGEAGLAPEHWPNNVGLLAGSERARLVMFTHPHCPCARASLAELERLLCRLRDRPLVAIVFIRPPGTAEHWAETPTMQRARAFSSVEIVCDTGGKLSQQFGAGTSGHTVFYDRQGRLRFSGGITASRGQEGTNAATVALAGLMRGTAAEGASPPVYGCPLFDPAATCAAKGTSCPKP